MHYTVFLISLLIHLTPQTTAQKIIPVKDLNNITITFGSCNKYSGEHNNRVFYRIAETNPDIWIWLGDAAYTDHRVLPTVFVYSGEANVKNKLLEVKNSLAYSHLRKSTNVIGVWDDHDFGLNNGGIAFPHKAITQQLWLDFIDESLESIRRKRSGIYESYYLGDPTKVKIILLDVRFNRDEDSGDLLGEEQWLWLDEQLKNNPSKITLIGSGVQVLPDDRFFPECWFPESRRKLYDMIEKYKMKGIILLSGDVHYAEIMKHPCRGRLGLDLYEFTSSGLTHNAGGTVPGSDKVIESVFSDVFNAKEDRFYERNFGMINIVSNGAGGPKIKLEAINYYGMKVLEKNLEYENISYKENVLNKAAYCELDKSRSLRVLKKCVQSIRDGDPYPIYLLLILVYVLLVLYTLVRIAKFILNWIFGHVGKYRTTNVIKRVEKLD